MGLLSLWLLWQRSSRCMWSLMLFMSLIRITKIWAFLLEKSRKGLWTCVIIKSCWKKREKRPKNWEIKLLESVIPWILMERNFFSSKKMIRKMGRKSKRPKKIVILILLGVMILISLINRFKKKLGILLVCWSFGWDKRVYQEKWRIYC